jgi:hypothetical protein
MDYQLLVPLITVLGAGLASYVGVKVALAEMRIKIEALEDTQSDLKSRVVRLESGYFQK